MSLGQLDDARATYTEATKTCKDSIPLWLLLADLEVRFPMQPSFFVPSTKVASVHCLQVTAGNVTKARSVVEKGRLRNPGNDLLWMKAVSTGIR